VSARVAVVIPARNCQATLDRVVGELPPGVAAYVVDDGSVPALRSTVTILRHDVNRGYGAAQKTGYRRAVEDGAEKVILLHGDGQYDVRDTLALAEALDDADAAIGSRFLSDPSVIPFWRRWGNRLLTGAANLRFGSRHTELHSGSRAFRASLIRALPLEDFSDDYVFDQEFLCALLSRGIRVAERPVKTHYDGTVQSISFGRAVVYGLGCLRVILRPPA
jgi:glycosyltransferase involved in cell wall biosynthesis